MKEKSFQEKISEKKERLSQLEEDLSKEQARGREPSAMQRLDIQIKEVIEQIGIVESQERAVQREPFIEKVVSILKELQTKALSQVDQWNRLRELYHLTYEIVHLLGVRRGWKRTGSVKVLIIDPVWRQRRLPSMSTSVRYPQIGMIAMDAGYGPDPRREGQDVFDRIEYSRAVQLQASGMVEIVDQGEPQYQEEAIVDESPEILRTIAALDFGLPVGLNGDGSLLPEFEKARKELGGFLRINFECMHQLVTAEKQAAKKK